MKKVVIYARYSSHSQREESIEQQVEECVEFAAKHDMTVVEVYADKAVSGRTDKRIAFQRMMRDAERKKFDCVVAYKSNRIARNMLNALQYEEKLAKLGIETYYCREEYGNTPQGRFALRMMMSMNQFYSENLSEDIKRGIQDNARNAKVNGRIPLGYKRGEDGKYAIDEKNAPIVREVFRRTKEGERLADIARDLNARGIKTKNGNDWNKGSFHRMLNNTTYYGTYRNSGITIENAVPPIVTKDEFEQVQLVLKNKDRTIGRKADYLLTGKLFCGECNAPMTGESGTSHTGTKYNYYSCKKCRKRVRQDEIEYRVCHITRDEFLTDEVIEWVAETFVKMQEEQLTDIPIIQAQIDNDEKAIQNLMRALADGYSRTLTEELKRLEEEVDALKRKIKRERKVDVTVEEVIFILEDFRAGNLEEYDYRESIIDSFVQRVVLWDDKIEISYFPTGKSGVRLESTKSHHSYSTRTCTVFVFPDKVVITRKLPS